MEREELIKHFWKFVERASDDRRSLSNAIEYLNTLLRNKKCIPPTVEIITVLRNERPILFQHLLRLPSGVEITFHPDHSKN